jgi:hypothetical protein
MKKAIVLSLMLWASGTLCAQILRIDHRQFAQDTTHGWLLGLQSDFFINNAGNAVDRQFTFWTIAATANISHFTKKNHYFWKSMFQYAEAGNAALISQGYSHFRIDFNYRDKASPEVFAQVQSDFARKLHLRLVGGGGYRHVLKRDEKTEIEYGLAGIFEFEQWENITGDDGLYVHGFRF